MPRNSKKSSPKPQNVSSCAPTALASASGKNAPTSASPSGSSSVSETKELTKTAANTSSSVGSLDEVNQGQPRNDSGKALKAEIKKSPKSKEVVASDSVASDLEASNSGANNSVTINSVANNSAVRKVAPKPPRPKKSARLFCDMCSAARYRNRISYSCGHLLDNHMENYHGVILFTATQCKTVNCKYAKLTLPDRHLLGCMPKNKEDGKSGVQQVSGLQRASSSSKMVVGMESSPMAPPSKEITADFLKKVHLCKKGPAKDDKEKAEQSKPEQKKNAVVLSSANAKPNAGKPGPKVYN